MDKSLMYSLALLLSQLCSSFVDDWLEAPTQQSLWSQWQGPTRDGQVHGAARPDRPTGKSLELLWRVDIYAREI